MGKQRLGHRIRRRDNLSNRIFSECPTLWPMNDNPPYLLSISVKIDTDYKIILRAKEWVVFQDGLEALRTEDPDEVLNYIKMVVLLNPDLPSQQGTDRIYPQ